MKKFLVCILLGWFCVRMFPLMAQPIPSLFQPLTWEQASLIAARENKLVMVEVGSIGGTIEKGIQKNRELVNYMLRNVIAIRMDMSTSAGREFEARLQLYPYPTYAFFMPYGDLVGVVTPQEVAGRPETLREGFQTAREIADVKKRNSRSVVFAEMTFQEGLAAAEEGERNVFIYIYSDSDQASLFMDKNVFNLDQVADFYNQNFVNLRFNIEEIGELVRKYALGEIPAFLYLNPHGKVLYRSTGYRDANQLLGDGNKALEKARGIPFENLSGEEAQRKAGQLGKLIFTDCYTTGSVHKELLRTVFADPEVTDFFTDKFVNVGREGNETCLIFSDSFGKELHRIVRVEGVEELLQEAERAVSGKGLEGMKQAYLSGERQTGFMEEYIRMLGRAGLKEEASRITMEYLSPLTPECLKQAKYWDFFYQYGIQATPELFEYVLGHRHELFALYGEEKVSGKITNLWIAGAEQFVSEGKFDEIGFKAYSKRLKQEKVQGWRLIVRNARMHAAEKVGDWKTFVTLAEEKWNEEQISDAELYRWGMKIYEKCQDENVRYKMAQWLAQRVMEMERREQLTGKIKISSYKGFLEKLVNDLLKKD